MGRRKQELIKAKAKHRELKRINRVLETSICFPEKFLVGTPDSNCIVDFKTKRVFQKQFKVGSGRWARFDIP